MISVSDALQTLFDLAPRVSSERIPLTSANGRILSERVETTRTQPPFDASSMDGYALGPTDGTDRFQIMGESAAGHPFASHINPGQAVRIFTGAVVPKGADRVLIQEDAERSSNMITTQTMPLKGANIRTAGSDFFPGQGLDAARRLTPTDIALLAAMNIADVPVARRPVVAIMATGDELVVPGETPGPGQIMASNTYGLHALFRTVGADVRILPIARDSLSSLKLGFDLAEGADLIVTIGGASVGDHDLVATVAKDIGMEQAFHKVAMRPGKPLMSGKLGRSMMIGLPGNPVSAMICGVIFVMPVLRAMMGLPPRATARFQMPLMRAIQANGPREHYMRARQIDGRVEVFDKQDSSLLSVLGSADLLVVRPPHDVAHDAGELVDCVSLTDTTV